MGVAGLWHPWGRYMKRVQTLHLCAAPSEDVFRVLSTPSGGEGGDDARAQLRPTEGPRALSQNTPCKMGCYMGTLMQVCCMGCNLVARLATWQAVPRPHCPGLVAR